MEEHKTCAFSNMSYNLSKIYKVNQENIFGGVCA